jgi:acetolactate synthase-1/2/3 large subunit
MIPGAKHPLIIVGPSGMKKAPALEAATGIPVVGMESPRGVNDPSLGAFAEVLAHADVVLLIGKRRDFTLKFGKPPAIRADCQVIELRVDSIDALLEEARKKKPPQSSWLGEVHAALAYRPPEWETATASIAGRLHPVQALRPLQAILDSHAQSVFISDGGEFGQWAQACLTAPHRVINGVAGSIGAALPFAVAARLAQPEAPVIAVMGDGTFGFHPAEIDTAVRYGLPFLLVVGNDARWNAEYQIQLRDYRRTIGTDLLPTRYDEVARAFGGYGELVMEAAEMLPAARRAIDSKLPAVLNVMIEGMPAPNIRR